MADRAIAEMKTFGHLSERFATSVQSLTLWNIISTRLRRWVMYLVLVDGLHALFPSCGTRAYHFIFQCLAEPVVDIASVVE